MRLFLAALRHGFLHAGENRALGNTLWRSVLFFVFGSCYWALLPLIAREQLHGGPGLFGVLVGCIGVGAVSGALLLPRLARARWAWTGLLSQAPWARPSRCAGFALLKVPALGMLAALIAGASWIASLSSLNVAAQLAVPDCDARARHGALHIGVLRLPRGGQHLLGPGGYTPWFDPGLAAVCLRCGRRIAARGPSPGSPHRIALTQLYQINTTTYIISFTAEIFTDKVTACRYPR